MLAVVSEWHDLDDEMKNLAFQRLNIYAIVAAYGWLTAIASSTAVSATPSNFLLPPGVVPVQRQQNANQNQQGRRGGRQKRHSSRRRLRSQPQLLQHVDEGDVVGELTL